MTLQDLLLKTKEIEKGTFVHMDFKSQQKTLAAHKNDIVEKFTSGKYRLGIEFAHMQANQGRDIQDRVWGSWEQGERNYILTHTNKDGTTKKYLRVYTTNDKSEVRYTLNGKPTTKDFLVKNGYISDRKSTATECFTVAIDNIIRLG